MPGELFVEGCMESAVQFRLEGDAGTENRDPDNNDILIFCFSVPVFLTGLLEADLCSEAASECVGHGLGKLINVMVLQHGENLSTPGSAVLDR